MSAVKLHLGCGGILLPGYVNIDGTARPNVEIDLVRDILHLNFPQESISEIRHHHVFEHFHRYEAVALMAAWNRWLEPEGKLVIETPNFEGCCTAYLGNRVGLKNSLREYLKEHLKPGYKQAKMEQLDKNRWRILRHLYGSKEAPWANHLEGWDRYTLGVLYNEFGFHVVQVVESSGGRVYPGVLVVGTKARSLTPAEFPCVAERFLQRMVTNAFELPIWLEQADRTYQALLNNPITRLPSQEGE